MIDKTKLLSDLKVKYTKLESLITQIQTNVNMIITGIIGPEFPQISLTQKSRVDEINKQYEDLLVLVKDIQTQENSLTATRKPFLSYIPNIFFSANLYKILLLLLISILCLPKTTETVSSKPIAVYIVDNPNPNPNPNPEPPIPPKPVPVAEELYAIQVFNSSATDAATQAAAAVAGDPSLDAELQALKVHWRHWDSQEPLIDSRKLRAYLPDPAALPVLLIYDSNGQFYDLNGNRLPRNKQVYQQPPKTAKAMIDAFKAIRANK